MPADERGIDVWHFPIAKEEYVYSLDCPLFFLVLSYMAWMGKRIIADSNSSETHPDHETVVQEVVSGEKERQGKESAPFSPLFFLFGTVAWATFAWQWGYYMSYPAVLSSLQCELCTE
jgi:hypothetical protein